MFNLDSKGIESMLKKTLAALAIGSALLSANVMAADYTVDKEGQPKELVSEKLVRQHHALPLWRRGNKLFIGVKRSLPSI